MTRAAGNPSNISNELYEMARRHGCQLQLGNKVTNQHHEFSIMGYNWRIYDSHLHLFLTVWSHIRHRVMPLNDASHKKSLIHCRLLFFDKYHLQTQRYRMSSRRLLLWLINVCPICKLHLQMSCRDMRMIGLTPWTQGSFFYFLGPCLLATSRNTGWMDIHEIFRIWTQEAVGYTVSRLSRLFHALQTRRGGGLRSRNASCC